MDGAVGADGAAVYDRLHQPWGRWRGVDLVDVQRVGVSQTADPAAREDAAGEIPVEATVASRSSSSEVTTTVSGIGSPSFATNRSNVPLSCRRASGRSGDANYLGDATEPLELGRDVERLLKGQHDHVDLMLAGDPLELGEKARRVAPRRRVDKRPARYFGWFPAETKWSSAA